MEIKYSHKVAQRFYTKEIILIFVFGKKDKAEQYYIQTLQNGDLKPYYFAANSALMLGLLKEDAKDTVAALDYYKRCLSMRNDEYILTSPSC